MLLGERFHVSALGLDSLLPDDLIAIIIWMRIMRGAQAPRVIPLFRCFANS